jgi:hypothetical protein
VYVLLRKKDASPKTPPVETFETRVEFAGVKVISFSDASGISNSTTPCSIK